MQTIAAALALQPDAEAEEAAAGTAEATAEATCGPVVRVRQFLNSASHRAESVNEAEGEQGAAPLGSPQETLRVEPLRHVLVEVEPGGVALAQQLLELAPLLLVLGARRLERALQLDNLELRRLLVSLVLQLELLTSRC